jgi:hypothetical protein
MGLLDAINEKIDTFKKSVNPFLQIEEGQKAPPPPATNTDPTGEKAARARGQAARQEAINRGKGIEVRQTPTGAIERKPFPE